MQYHHLFTALNIKHKNKIFKTLGTQLFYPGAYKLCELSKIWVLDLHSITLGSSKQLCEHLKLQIINFNFYKAKDVGEKPLCQLFAKLEFD